MKLVLFDIDGTIMDSGGAGTRGLDLAFSEVFSIDDAFRDVQMAGKTDIQIIKEALSKHGLPSENGAIPQVIAAYVQHLSREIHNDRKHVKPGITEALDALRSQGDNYLIGLLTGNIRRGAMLKLSHFAIDQYFASGAFGDDHEDRNKLLPIAVERFRGLSGRDISFGDCVVVGDTPRDVYCSKPYGARCIGVATGPYPAADLVKAGADMVFEDLTDTAAFITSL